MAKTDIVTQGELPHAQEFDRGLGRKYLRILSYARTQSLLLAAIVGVTLVGAAATALQPWPLKILVDFALGSESPPATLTAFIGMFDGAPAPPVLVAVAAISSLLLFALTTATGAGLTWLWGVAGERMVYHLAGDLFRQLQCLSLSFHRRRSVGDSLNRLTGDSSCVYTVTEGILVSPSRNLLTLVMIGMLAWTLDPALTIFSMAFVPAVTSWSYFYGRRVKHRARQHREARSRVMAFVQETLAAVPMVQAFSREDRNRDRFLRLSAAAATLAQRNKLLAETFGLINGLATTAGLALVLYLGGLRVLSGAVSLGTLLVFLAYTRPIQNATRGLLSTYISLKTAEAKIDRVLEILDAREMVQDLPHARPLRRRPAAAGSLVRYERVTFGYEPDRAVLHDVDLELSPGEVLALVGPSGAGKSTLVSMIPRFFDPWQGRILLDGADLREIQLASLRAHIAIVPQEPYLMPLSIAENIAYGRTDATRREIVAAAKVANADGFIRNMSRGYETRLGERGTSLSGGERQRISIARALIKDPSVLILDEPTSALDAETETLLLEALERLMVGRTTVVIAHRESTIRRADRIAVLEQGRLTSTEDFRNLCPERPRHAGGDVGRAVAPTGGRTR